MTSLKMPKFPKINFGAAYKAGKWLYAKYDGLSPEQKEKVNELVKKLYEKLAKKDEE
jgi:hypothetical protein